MAWSWSNAHEAYALAKKNLGKKPKAWLAECLAEWKCKQIDKAVEFVDEALLMSDLYEHGVDALPSRLRTDPLLDGRYDQFVKEAKTKDKEHLVEEVWGYAAGHKDGRTCDNYGHSPWMCPHGCHTVEWERIK